MEDTRQAVRRRWAGVVVMALLLVGAGGVARMTRPVEVPAPTPTTSGTSVDPRHLPAMTAAAPGHGTVVGTMPETLGGALPPRETATGDGLECDDTAASSPSRDDAAARQRVNASMDASLKTLAASPNPVDRAIAIMAAPMPDSVASQPLTSARKQKAYLQGLERAQETRVAALADFARQVEDPTVFGLAARACSSRLPRLEAACAGFTPLSWVQREPSNGTAWLAVARDALARGDNGGVDEALYRAAVALRFDSGFRIAARTVYGLDGPEVTEQARFALLMQSLQAWAPTMALSLDACRDDAIASDENRLQICIALGRTMVAVSEDTRDAVVGAGLLERLAQDPGPRRTLSALSEASHRVNVAALRGATPCEQARVISRQTRRDAEIGELASMREAVASSPR